MFLRFYTLLWCLLLFGVNFSHTSYVNHPDINFDTLDRLVFTGSYNGISIYKDTDQLTYIQPNTSSVISFSNDTLKLLASSNFNGTIYDTCLLSDSIYFAGNFSTINNVKANNIASVNLKTNKIELLEHGLDGPVYTLYCDDKSKQLFAGGAFVAPISSTIAKYTNSLSQFGGGVAVWKDKKWIGLPWKGFNGPVYSIIKKESTNTLYFGGNFDTTTDGQNFHAPGSYPVGLSSSTAVGNNTATGSPAPSTIICADENNASPWYLADNTVGTWQASFSDYSVNPSLIRIANSKLSGHQTKGFSIRSLTDSSVYSLTYLDPDTNTTKTCSTNCTLSNNKSITYQDFRITNLALSSGIAIDIHSWYGTSGGLASVKVFQSEIFTYVVNDNVSNVCTTVSNSLPKITTSGIWVSSNTTVPYLVSSISDSNKNPSITIYPNLVESGIYEVLLYSPSCDTDSCTGRSSVDVTISTTSSSKENTTISQTETSGTSIYSGYFEVSDTFTPSIKLSLSSNATTSSRSAVSIVAYAVQFVKFASNDALSSIAQYNYTQTADIKTDNIPWGALTENVPYKSTVRTMTILNDDIYIGGDFSSVDSSNSKYSNIVKYDTSTNKLKALSGEGTNGIVYAITAANNKEIFVGGSFSGISGSNTTVEQLNNVARFDTETSTWKPLTGGVNGLVSALTFVENKKAVLVAGRFDELLQASGKSSPKKTMGNAFWDISNQKFTTVSDIPYLSGTIRSSIRYNSNDYFVGSIDQAYRYQVNGLSYTTSTQSDKVSLFDEFTVDDDYSNIAINTGFFNKSDTTEITVLGGQFQLKDGIQNIALYQNGSWSGFKGSDWQGDINTMSIHNDLILVGGNFSSSTASYLAAFSITNKSLSLTPTVKSGNAKANVHVIRSIPQQEMVVVAGSFSTIDATSCSAVCSMNSKTLQWSSLSSSLDGEVFDAQYINDSLIVGGDLTLSGSPLYIAKYDFSNKVWSSIGSTNLPGPSHSISYDNTTYNIYVSGTIDGSSDSYLYKWNGESFVSLGKELKSGSIISNLAVLPLNTKNGNSAQQNTLLASGYINLGTCNVSSAFFDETQGWIPYLVTSNVKGAISAPLKSLFYKNQPFFAPKPAKKYLPKVATVFISIAISVGIVSGIMFIALFIVRLQKKKNNELDPQNNPSTYYGKPPRSSEALLAALKADSSDEKVNNKGYDGNDLLEEDENEHREFYNMAKSISTEHLHNPVMYTPMANAFSGTIRRAPIPPSHINQQPQSYHNIPISTTTIDNNTTNANNYPYNETGLAASMYSNNQSKADSFARPDSFVRPFSEIQRDSFASSMYNHELPPPREVSENSRSYSPFNPFRKSEIGMAVTDVNSGLTANQYQQQGSREILQNNRISQQSGYNNGSKSSNFISGNSQVKAQDAIWTTAPLANVGTAYIAPISSSESSDKSSDLEAPKGLNPPLRSGINKQPNEIRWTTAKVPAPSSAVVEPISTLNLSRNSWFTDFNENDSDAVNDYYQMNEMSQINTESNGYRSPVNNLTTVPTTMTFGSNENAYPVPPAPRNMPFSPDKTIPITNVPTNMTFGAGEKNRNVSQMQQTYDYFNAEPMPNASDISGQKNTGNNTLTSSKAEPVTKDSEGENFHSLYNSMLSTSGGFSSDPEFTKFTANQANAIQNKTSSEDNYDYDKKLNASKNQYHASLSSLVWPESNEAEETSTDPVIANNYIIQNGGSDRVTYGESSVKDKKSVSGQSFAGPLSPIKTQGFHISLEDLTKNDESAQWKEAKVASPITTGYAPLVLEPSTAKITTRTPTEVAKTPLSSKSEATQVKTTPAPYETYDYPTLDYLDTQDDTPSMKSIEQTKKSYTDNSTDDFDKKETAPKVVPIKASAEEPKTDKNEDTYTFDFLMDDEGDYVPPLQDFTIKKSDINFDVKDKRLSSNRNTLDGRASSKRMVEEYLSLKKTTPEDKKSKYKSDFRSIMHSALENNTKTTHATEDNPHLYYAKFGFSALDEGELGFEKKDPIIVLDSVDEIWWTGYKVGADGSFIRGIFPSNYVEVATSILEE